MEDLDLTKILAGEYWGFDEMTEGETRTLNRRFAEERPWDIGANGKTSPSRQIPRRYLRSNSQAAAIQCWLRASAAARIVVKSFGLGTSITANASRQSQEIVPAGHKHPVHSKAGNPDQEPPVSQNPSLPGILLLSILSALWVGRNRVICLGVPWAQKAHVRRSGVLLQEPLDWCDAVRVKVFRRLRAQEAKQPHRVGVRTHGR